MDTLTKSCSPRIVITANGEVQTHEEAIVYVKELDIFLTMKVLENTPAVLSVGKFCDENGYFHEGINSATRRTSFLSWFQACLRVKLPLLSSMTLSRLESHSSSSSSTSSSSSPTMTSSTETDHSVHPPAIVSSESVESQVWGYPCG